MSAVSSSSSSSIDKQIQALELEIAQENASKTDSETVKQQKVAEYEVEIETLTTQEQLSSATSLIDLKA
jgi:hypothetical protein